MTHIQPFLKCSLSWAHLNFARANTRWDDCYHVQLRKLRLTEEKALAYGRAGREQGRKHWEGAQVSRQYRLSLLLNTCPCAGEGSGAGPDIT